MDSISSSISDARFSIASNTNGNFHFPPRMSYDSSVISDSDDDLSARSHRSSIDSRDRRRSNSANLQGPASPAMSLSSLKSFNQGFSQGLNLTHVQYPISIPQQAQLVELYYQFVHPTFSILPLNRQSLSALLTIPPPPQQSHQIANDVAEVNQFVIQGFYNSLQLLLSTTTRTSTPNVLGLGMDSAVLQDSINRLFQSWFKIATKVTGNISIYSQNVVILLGMSIVTLCYSVVLLGFTKELNIRQSVGVFNRLKVFKLFWIESHVVTNSNYDDYSSLLKRLYVYLIILDSLESLSIGEPSSTGLVFDSSTVTKLFPTFKNFDLAKNNMMLGLKLAEISNLRDMRKSPRDTPVSPVCKAMKLKSKLTHDTFNRNVEQDQISGTFWDFIVSKYEIEAFLEEVIVSHREKLDEELLYDQQLKCLRLAKKHITIQTNLLSAIKNNTNSIDLNLPISPFLPLIFKQSVRSVNISKIIINSLMTNSDLVPRLSKQLNEVIGLINYLSLLKPFKSSDLNNHLAFEFRSAQLQWFENDERPSASKIEILTRWVGLIADIHEYMKSDDFEGWCS